MTAPEQTLPRYPFSTDGDRLSPRLDEMRARCPVARVATNGGDEAWLVTGHREARTVLRDPRFARSQVAAEHSPVQDSPIFAPELLDALEYLRRAGLYEEVRRALGPDLPDLPEEWLAGEARAALAELPGPGGGRADLQPAFAARLAGRAMCRLLGLPAADLPRLAAWADTDLTMGLPTEAVHANWRGLRDHLMARMAPFADGERPPGAGLLPRLAAANAAGPADPEGATGPNGAAGATARALTREQLANVLGVVFVAGYEDLASFLGVAAFHLLGRPDALDELRTCPESAHGHVEEALRFSVVLGNALARIATEETELAGVRLSPGEMVLVSTDAANHDPSAFPEPHRYIPERRPNPHLRFGHGPHYCPGAHLTRVVSRVAFTELARVPGLRLAVPPEQVGWVPDRMAIMPAALPVHRRA
ncbi:cytochrome P450 [Nocardiopsis potens]|uniref:cytochrome P450 n=1 Tax=Nocardiopsis potens TaxID=1246458 RepID=UPI00034C8464|nr:cytochrome P450 [Nocardiopsis potens]